MCSLVSVSMLQGKASVKTDIGLCPWDSIELCKTHHLAGSFLSHFIGDSLVVSSFTLSVTHAIAVIFPGTSALSQIFSPKVSARG